MGRVRIGFLCLFVLAQWGTATEAFKGRSLSAELLTAKVNAVPIPNVTLPAASSVATAVLANFPANLTGNLTGIKLPNATELLLIEQYVLNHTRPVVKSFIDGNNATIDCVPILLQLSLANPALQNHTLTTVPPKAPALNTTRTNSSLKSNSSTAVVNSTTASQHVITPAANATSVNGTGLNISGGCPAQSVPVPRLTVADIARFGSLQAFLNSTAKKVPPPNVTVQAPDAAAAATGHEHAYLFSYYNQPPAYYGIQTTLSVWQPFVDTPPNGNEFSLSQVWVLGGPFDNTMQSVEAGWQVEPVSYGDSRPRLFIFSTRAGYTDTVCYAGRADCPSSAATFVQVSQSVYPTMPLTESGNGYTSEYTLLVVRDFPTGNWWVKLGDEWVGYYPGTLYANGNLGQSASLVEVGGEIVDSAHLPGAPPGEAHTKTTMGSGVDLTQQAPSTSTTAYHSKMYYVDNTNSLQSLDNIFAYSFDYSQACYSGQVMPSTDSNNNAGPNYFFFGGPGYSAQCT